MKFKIDLEKPEIKRAFNYDLTDVKERFAKEHSVSSSLTDELEIELKRFLILCSKSNKVYGMRGPVDDLWHTFVIFTKKYFDFCDKLKGKYIHHTPHTTGKSKDQIISEESNYTNFLEDYYSVFGLKPPKHIWPKPVTVVAEQGCYGGCSEGCNDCEGSSDDGGGWSKAEISFN